MAWFKKKKNTLKRFLTPPPSPSPDPHTLVKAVCSLNVAVPQNGSFPGHLLSNNGSQGGGVVLVYFENLGFHSTIPGDVASF